MLADEILDELYFLGLLGGKSIGTKGAAKNTDSVVGFGRQDIAERLLHFGRDWSVSFVGPCSGRRSMCLGSECGLSLSASIVVSGLCLAWVGPGGSGLGRLTWW